MVAISAALSECSVRAHVVRQRIEQLSMNRLKGRTALHSS
jgi:hypothetical protein